MAGQSIAGALGTVLKTRYLGQLRKTLNNATVFLSKIEKKVQPITGQNFTIALHTNRSNSVAVGLPEDGSLPDADRQEYGTTIVPNKYIYSTLMVTGPAIAAARDSAGSFVEALESEVDGLQRDTKRAFNRILHGPGADVLGYIAATANTTAHVIDDNQGNPFVHIPSGKRLEVDIFAGTNYTTHRNSGSRCWAVLGAKAATNYAIEFFDAASGGSARTLNLTDGDVVVPVGNINASTGVAYTPMGLQGIVSNGNPQVGNLQGQTATATAWWQAQVFGNSGTLRQLDLADMQEVIDTIATQTDYSESDISMMLCNYPVRRAYFKAMIAERRQVNTMKLDGGWSALDFNGMPFVVDSQCRRNVIYYLVLDTMGIVRTSDFDWMDKDGSYLARVDGKDAYEAVLFHYGNLACYNRVGNGLLSDLIEA